MCDNHRKRAHRLDTIVQMLKDGVLRTDIADAADVHLNTLKRYIARHGRPTRLTDEQKTWLKDHYDDTASTRDMARGARVSESTMCNRLIDAGTHKPESDVLSGRWGC